MSTLTKSKKPAAKPAPRKPVAKRKPARRVVKTANVEPIEYVPSGSLKTADWELKFLAQADCSGPLDA